MSKDIIKSRGNKELATRKNYPLCPKCDLVLDPHAVDCHMSRYCPRCAYDLHTIDLGTEVATVEQIRCKQGEKAYYDLQLMLENWSGAFKQNIRNEGVDYSSLHEFLQDFFDNMVPYLSRLYQEEYISKDQVEDLSTFAMDKIYDIKDCLEEEEQSMRLSGRWNDKEEEIKLYWLDKMNLIEHKDKKEISDGGE